MIDSARPIVDYGRWPSPLTPERVFARSETVSNLRPGRHGLFFLLGLPAENNAQVLMYLDANGTCTRVSPPGMNLRSQVHEYGGLPYCLGDASVFYCNLDDQRIYHQAFDELTLTGGAPAPLTPFDSARPKALRYAELLYDAQRQRLIAVREDHRDASREARNTLVAIALDAPGEGEILFSGTDFVVSPSLSPDGRQLAFQTWSHPNMPWDDTEIRIAQFDAAGRLQKLRTLCAERAGSKVLPSFGPGGELYFIADWSDWWNLYRIANPLSGPAAGASGCVAVPVAPVDAELCSSQFVLGQHSYDCTYSSALLFARNRNCVWSLASAGSEPGTQQQLLGELGTLEHVFWQHGRAVFLAATAHESAAIRSVDPQQPSRSTTLYRPRSEVNLARDNISVPQHFTFATGEGQQAYALYYPPVNPACRAPEGALPPVLVSVHGGPTGSARSAFNPAVQFWTSRGFGWCDVNYRGSTGYGRRFRHSLYGEWGVADIEDVINAAQQLLSSGRADPRRMAIRGSSAGGYAVLAALAAGDTFSAGVSYYGVCDLELLARDTHKFESRYLDQLIGPWPEQAALYRDRSPLYQIDRIKAPVLLLQGMQDKVVPPNQAEMIYRQLRKKSPDTRYIHFEDEGHGFRKPANQMAALQAELDFYTALFL